MLAGLGQDIIDRARRGFAADLAAPARTGFDQAKVAVGHRQRHRRVAHEGDGEGARGHRLLAGRRKSQSAIGLMAGDLGQIGELRGESLVVRLTGQAAQPQLADRAAIGEADRCTGAAGLGVPVQFGKVRRGCFFPDEGAAGVARPAGLPIADHHLRLALGELPPGHPRQRTKRTVQRAKVDGRKLRDRETGEGAFGH